MASRAEMWLPSAPAGERRTRLLAALAVSLLSHALVLWLAPEWRGGAPTPSPLLVTMVEPGRGDGGVEALRAAPGPVAAAPAAPMPAVPVPPAVAVPRMQAPRRVASRAVRAAVPPAVAAAVPVAAPQAVAAAPQAVAAAPQAVAAATDPTSASAPTAQEGARGDRDDGASAGGGGAVGTGSGGGRGTSAGSGSDGLRALCASCPAPDYPSRARRQGWQGTVDVALAIAGDGAVADANVAHSSGYPALDEVALGVARQSRFAVPAGGAGLRGQLRYRFVLDATAARR